MLSVQDRDLARGGDEYDGIRRQLVVDYSGIAILKNQKLRLEILRWVYSLIVTSLLCLQEMFTKNSSADYHAPVSMLCLEHYLIRVN